MLDLLFSIGFPNFGAQLKQDNTNEEISAKYFTDNSEEAYKPTNADRPMLTDHPCLLLLILVAKYIIFFFFYLSLLFFFFFFCKAHHDVYRKMHYYFPA